MIYVTGDTHGSFARVKDCIDIVRRKGGQYLIILGDFGLIWEVSDRGIHKESRRNCILSKYAEARGVQVLFIDGNHENFNRLLAFPKVDKFGAVVGQIEENIFHLQRGYVYTVENNQIFTMGGGISIDKNQRQENVSWWPQEMQSKAEQDRALDTLDACNWKVDYILTHSAPMQAASMLNKTLTQSGYYGELKMNTLSAESKFHSVVYERATFKGWYFGHYHQDYDSGNLHVLYTRVLPLI